MMKGTATTKAPQLKGAKATPWFCFVLCLVPALNGWAGKFAREKTPDRAHRGVKGSISTTGTKDTTKNETKEERAYEEERALSRLKQLSAMPRCFLSE